MTAERKAGQRCDAWTADYIGGDVNPCGNALPCRSHPLPTESEPERESEPADIRKMLTWQTVQVKLVDVPFAPRTTAELPSSYPTYSVTVPAPETPSPEVGMREPATVVNQSMGGGYTPWRVDLFGVSLLYYTDERSAQIAADKLNQDYRRWLAAAKEQSK